MTFNEAEALLAVHLEELGLHFESQYLYCPGRKFRADFAVWNRKAKNWREYGTHETTRFALIEVQGGIYSKQAHGSITGILKDNERLFEAFRNHWPMIRFTPDQVTDGTAKALIAEALGREP